MYYVLYIVYRILYIVYNISYIIRVRVLGTDYGSSWVHELTWALVPGGELFAAAAAAAAHPHRKFEGREPRQF